MSELLTVDEQQELLKIARNSILEYVTTSNLPLSETKSAGLLLQNGCFVSIKQNGKLRGCIGNFISEKPLHNLVQEMAASAATRDPRFYPMKTADLDSFTLEISVLSPLKKIETVEEIEVGKHGIFIVKNSNQGVLLPQVATEYGWDREMFLKQTCVKAGLTENAWQKGCEIYIFSAAVFSE